MVFHYYVIIFSFFLLKIYIFLLSWWFIIVSELFSSDVLQTFVNLSAILLPIKSAVAAAVSWTSLYEAVLTLSWQRPLANQWTGFYMITASVMKELNVFVMGFLVRSRNFKLYLPPNIFTHIFRKRQKSITFYKYLGSIE